MQSSDTTVNAFFALLKAGLWEQGIRLSPFEGVDYAALYRLADEQAVEGLVAAGLEWVVDMKPPEEALVPFMRQVFLLEKTNAKMNRFIGELIPELRASGIEAVLVKGQGVAQCYSRPLWRTSGDVDLLLNGPDYEKAKLYLPERASCVKKENPYTKHLKMKIDPWVVELHGNMRANVLARMDRQIDRVQEDIFENKGVRVWKNGEADILLPSPDNDLIMVFTHILHHFYRGGVCLRQFCDWCRLLYTYRGRIDEELLGNRLRQAGIMPEWKGFGQFVVDCLGMPQEAMPFYASPSARDRRRIKRIWAFIHENGNFGHNRDQSFYVKYPFLVRKTIAFWRKGSDILYHFRLFPDNSFRYFFRFLIKGLAAAFRGEG